MASCTLHIGSRIVTRAEGGTLDAEYALFDAHEIELRSNNEPGTVREHGYGTTVQQARERLEAEGATHDLAEAVADAMRPGLAASYARGPALRRVAAQLDAAEMLEGGAYDPRTKKYEGAWLDVDALARDCGVERAGTALQALHIAAVLAGLPDETRVQLVTGDYTRDRRPGERTLRRVPLAHASHVLEAIRTLGLEPPPSSPEREVGPSLADLRAALRVRAPEATKAARERYAMIERITPARVMPARGPLGDAELWAMEVQLGTGDATGLGERLDAIERARGRSPATAYLRARIALVAGSEEVHVIAERASALAQSLSDFAELELLAAEAWARAGDGRRACAYARDVVANVHADEEVRERASAIVYVSDRLRMSSASLRASVSTGSTSTMRAASPRQSGASTSVSPTTAPTMPSSVSPAIGHAGSASPMALHGSPPSSRSFRAATPDVHGPPSSARAPGERGAVSISAMPAVASSLDDATVRERLPASARPPSVSRPPPPQEFFKPPPPTRPPERMPSVSAAQRVSEANMPVEPRPAPPSFLSPQELPTPPPRRSIPGSLAPTARMPSAAAPTRGTSAPPIDAPLRDSARRVEAAAAAAPETARSPSEPPPDSERDPSPFMKGASQPPFRTDAPPSDPTESAALPLPPAGGAPVELAATLSLPPGLETESLQPGELPHTVGGARALFTLLSRELGHDYKKRYGIELRTDLRSIEIMQRHLKERFPDDEITREDEALEIRRHGAFLSEILARTLGAEWVDIGLSEVGYWAMKVPPVTRVWPFGRVLRFVSMGHTERDLVSYFLELERRQLKARG